MGGALNKFASPQAQAAQWRLWEWEASGAPVPIQWPTSPWQRRPSYLPPWPVHAGSVAKASVRFVPLSRKQVIKWYYQAEAWAPDWNAPGGGRAALAVLRALIFKFMNWRTGRLDPSYVGIAAKAGYKRSTVHTALRYLQSLGLVDWVRCCETSAGEDGRFELRQQTNAYILIPPSQWRGYRDPRPAPPTPEPATWGATPPLPEVVEAVKAATAAGASIREKLALAEQDDSPLMTILARHLRRQLSDPPD